MGTPITIKELAAWLAEQNWSSFAQSLARAYTRWGRLSEKQEAAARSMHAKCMTRNAAREASKSATPPDVGFYCTSDGTFYRVQSNKAKTNVYAKELVAPHVGARPYWKYVGRLPFSNLGSDAKLTREQAATFGHTHGHCLICTRELSDEESVMRGVGPVCWSKQGWG